MKQIALYSALLILGLSIAQFADLSSVAGVIQIITYIGLSYIMIQVGREFEIDKSNLGQYGKDYLIAFTTATFPWAFVVSYYIFVISDPSYWFDMDMWKETLVLGRFAAPTSAGILFAMLAAAGLGTTWLFSKARTLAIFDDLDTVLLMIPLMILVSGWSSAMGAMLALILVMLVIGYKHLHKWNIPHSAKSLLIYSVIIVIACAGFDMIAKGFLGADQAFHMEVLLPAFVLGCLMKSQHESKADHKVSGRISAAFMLFVGLCMPAFFAAPAEGSTSVTAGMEQLSMGVIAMHVLVVTLISNIGKMFPFFCYRDRHWRERLALSIGMFPRGEVGAGVIMVAVGYGFGGPMLTISIMSLALNLVLTGLFIAAAKKLVEPVYGEA